MSDALQGIGKLVPGFDFLQGLVKSAGTALPNFTQWVAPTLNPEELEKRIGELRTVQFWLEQNARMLGATIQAMEVQRMTLSTLQTMNVPVEALRESLKARVPENAAPPAEAAEAPEAEPQAPARKAAARKSSAKSAPGSAQQAAAGMVDPMQWWGALTKQFTTLATNTMTEALKDTASESARNLAGNLVKQSFSAAEETLRKTMEPARKVAAAAGKAAASRKPATASRKSRANSAPKPPAKT